MRDFLPVPAAILVLLLHSFSGAHADGTQDVWEPFAISLSVNGREVEPGSFVYRKGRDAWALPEAVLADLGVKPGGMVLHLDGASYRVLEHGSDVSFEYDVASSQLAILMAPKRFHKRILNGDETLHEGLALARPVNAVFAELDVNIRSIQGQTRGEGVLGIGVSGRRGFGFGRWASAGESGPPVRLDTSFIYDNVTSRTTLVVGDWLAPGATMMPELPFGGVSWYTNFEIDSTFIPFALPTIAGSASAPGVIDVRINGQPQDRFRTDEGPFEIQDIRMPAGAGHIEIVSRDIFGGVSHTVQPVYVAPENLRAGLSSFGLSFGWQREDYGTKGFNYDYPFGRAVLRNGFTDWLTIAGAIEASESIVDAAIGADLVVGHFATATMGIGASRAQNRLTADDTATVDQDRLDAEQGLTFNMSVNRQTSGFGFGAGANYMSSGYRQIGGIRRQTVKASYNVLTNFPLLAGIFGASAAWIDRHEDHGYSVATLNYTRGIADGSQLNIGGSITSDEDNRFNLRAALVVPFGIRRNLFLSKTRTGGRDRTRLAVSKSLPPGYGFGYDASIEDADTLNMQARVRGNGRAGKGFIEILRQDTDTGLRGSFQSGLVLAQGQLFAAQNPMQGVVLIETPSAPNMPIRLNNKDVGNTGQRGRALLEIQPFILNQISLDEALLPVDQQLERDMVQITVGRGRAAVVRIETLTSLSVAAVVRLPDGTLPSAGTRLEAEGEPEPLPVGYDGMVFLSSETPVRTYDLVTPKFRCSFEVHFEHPQSRDSGDGTFPSLLCQ